MNKFSPISPFFQTEKKQGQDEQHKRSYISNLHRYGGRRVPSQNWSRVASHRGVQGMFDHITQSDAGYG